MVIHLRWPLLFLVVVSGCDETIDEPKPVAIAAEIVEPINQPAALPAWRISRVETTATKWLNLR